VLVKTIFGIERKILLTMESITDTAIRHAINPFWFLGTNLEMDFSAAMVT
jgi:hypothetical protein